MAKEFDRDFAQSAMMRSVANHLDCNEVQLTELVEDFVDEHGDTDWLDDEHEIWDVAVEVDLWWDNLDPDEQRLIEAGKVVYTYDI